MTLNTEELNVINTVFAYPLRLDNYDLLALGNTMKEQKDSAFRHTFINLIRKFSPTHGEIQQQFEKLADGNSLKALHYLQALSNSTLPKTGDILSDSKLSLSFKPAILTESSETCPLCLENYGLEKKRRIFAEIDLNGRPYLLQCPPASYFKGHMVLLSAEHRPLSNSPAEIADMLEFADRFPGVTVAANNSFERIGGSIPSHCHYQIKDGPIPLYQAKTAKRLHGFLFDLDAEILNWPVPCYRFTSGSKVELVRLYEALKHTYESKKWELIINREEGKHNALNPLVSKNQNLFQLDLCLRSNARRGSKYIYDTDKRRLCIKKSGIGVFECGGHFVLEDESRQNIEKLRAFIAGTSREFPIDFAGLIRRSSIPKDFTAEKFILNQCALILKDVSVFHTPTERNIRMAELFADSVKSL